MRLQLNQAIDAVTPPPTNRRQDWKSRAHGFLFAAHSVVVALFLSLPSICRAATVNLAIPDQISSTGAGSSYLPLISRDASGVAFVSHANNLVTNDDQGPWLDLFWHDLSAARTELLSVRLDGIGGGNQNVAAFAISANGQVIAFETAAGNLVSGDSNNVSDIFVRDRAANTTRLVSVVSTDTRSGNRRSFNPSISSDGRYLLFESEASDLVANDLNGTNDVFVRDLVLGTTSLVSLDLVGAHSANGASHSPVMTPDGRYLAFVSHATNIVDGVTNTAGEVYVQDRLTGSNVWAVASHLPAFRLPLPTPFRATQPQLSADGRFVAFKVSNKIVRFDTHRPTNSIRLSFPLEPPVAGLSNFFTFEDNPRSSSFREGVQASDLAMSDDGRFVAVGTGTNGATFTAVHRIDFETLLDEVALLSTGGGGVMEGFYYVTNHTHISELISSNQAPLFVRAPAMSGDGRKLAYLGEASDGSRRSIGLWLHDRVMGSSQLVSTNQQGMPSGDLEGIVPALAWDGSRLAWESLADDLLENDANRDWDVFARDLTSGELQTVSRRYVQLPCNTALGLSKLPTQALSADGRHVAFLSFDGRLWNSDTNSFPNAYVYDRVIGTNSLVSIARGVTLDWFSFFVSNHVGHVSLSLDGRYAAFTWVRETDQSVPELHLFWRDLGSDSSRLVASGGGLAPLRLGADARLVALQSQSGLDSAMPDSNQSSDIYLKWMGPAASSPLARETVAVSVVPDNSSTGNGPAFNAEFSPDGSWIVFQSTAGDLTPIPYPPPANAQLMARRLGPGQAKLSTPIRLLSYLTEASPIPDSYSIDTPVEGGAGSPKFSADSRYVVFEVGSNSVYRHDLHQDVVLTVTSNQVGEQWQYFTNTAHITNTLVCTGCGAPSISGDGRFVAYESRPVSGGPTNLFLKDLLTEQTELVSATSSGTAANGRSFQPLLSHDARYVIFSSKASNLVPNDNNGATDVFVRDRFAGVTFALSSGYRSQGTGNRVSSDPVLSADGRTVAFQSFASDLIPGDFNDTRDVFVVTLSGPDVDGDGLDDEWEMTYFNTLARDGTEDMDGDGASDAAEYRAGTNPANNVSFLRVLRLTTVAQGEPTQRATVLLWSSIPGRSYRVQTKSAVEDAWAELNDTVIATSYSAQTIHTVTDSLPRYYRVRLLE
jgi:Tol biopolymer transport system component